MDDGSPNISIIVILICLIVNIIINGFGAASLLAGEISLEKYKEKYPGRVEKAIKLQENPVKFINTLWAVTMLTTMLMFVFAYNSFGKLIFAEFVKAGLDGIIGNLIAYVIIIAIIMIVNLVVGVVVPKKIASHHAGVWLIKLYYVSCFFITIFTPVTFLVNLISKIILIVFKIDINKDYDEVTEEEIMSMVNEGHELGVIEASEAEMITNIFEYGEKEASDIMTHRKNILALDGELTLKEAVNYIITQSKSRLPVYLEDIDNIIGILHIKDIIEAITVEGNEKIKLKDISEIFNKPIFIPETRKIDDLFKKMQSEKTHMVIVIDEYGQTAGLITMEDILEEIVGNIMDEHDEEETNIQYVGDDTYLINGMTTLEEIEDSLGLTFDEEDYDTINGFLISKLDRIPGDEERPVIEVDGCIYRIIAIENKMISLLELTLPKKSIEEND